MRKIFFIVLINAICTLLYSQQYPNAIIVSSPELGTSTTAIVNCSYYLPIPGYSEVYATGVVWSTSNNTNSLNFGIGEWGDPNNFTNPTQYMKFEGGKTSTGHVLVIGDGGPVSRGGNKMTATLQPGTTYYARAFVYAKVCISPIKPKKGSVCDNDKSVWYSNIIQITTPSSNPISNNTISTSNKTICAGSGIPALIGSSPSGATGQYAYQWQSNTDVTNTSNWVNIVGATSANLTPSAPSPLNVVTPVWYRRIVTSGTFADSMDTNPVLYTYLPSNQQLNLTIYRLPFRSDSMALKASLYPGNIPLDSVLWKVSTSESGPYTVISKNSKNIIATSLMQDTVGTKYYKVYTTVGGCLQDSSPFVTLTPKDGNGNRYLSTKIGSKYWMIENLRTTKYRDNTAISKLSTNTNWANTTAAGYCWYDNDSLSNSFSNGALYNLFIDTTKVCPAGWKVPAIADINTLVALAGGSAVSGGALSIADQNFWSPDNVFAKNSLGMNLLPSGYRAASGLFFDINGKGRYWSTKVNPANAAENFLFGIDYDSNAGRNSASIRKNGCSVRCIKE